MKRFFIALFALTTLVVCFADLQDKYPAMILHSLAEDGSKINQFEGISPKGAEFMNSMYAPPRMVDGVEMVEAFINIEDKCVLSAVKAQGVIVNCVFDGFVTALIPVDRLANVSRIPGVQGVELSKLVQLATDSTLSVTHAGQVLQGTEFGLPQAYDGSGVIIGIIDNGFDYQHIAFKSAQDSSRNRIVRVYDPNNTTGHPAIVDSEVLSGSVFMGGQIDTLTTDDHVNGNPHGTHVAGIAAGQHINGYGGMAPGAELVMCVAPSISYGISEVEIINCMKYIFSYADSVGKPCVINLSVSTFHGPHDGEDQLSKAIAQSVGPGRIFVIAAGNSARIFYFAAGYACGEVTDQTPLNVSFEQFNSGYDFDFTYWYKDLWCSTWFRAQNAIPVVQFHILDKQTRRIVWQSEKIKGFKMIDVSEISDYYEPYLSYDTTAYILSHLLMNVSTRKVQVKSFLHNLMCKSYSIVDGIYTSRYKIGMSIFSPSATKDYFVDTWLCTELAFFCYDESPVYVEEEAVIDGDTVSTYTRVNNYYALPNANCTIGTYAVSDSVISVGGFVGRDRYFSLNNNKIVVDEYVEVGAPFSFSSYQLAGAGPTGKPLPTVTAPAVNVVSSVSRYSYFDSSSPTVPLVVRDGDNLWGAMTGTSMAAPTVAGIIAQWLQINPNLSPGNIKTIIEKTAKKDSYTSSSPRFGPNGKIDALAGVRYLLNMTEPQFLIGDANNDGVVNISDISVIIDYLLDNDPTGVSLPAADYNQDGIINITDVSLLTDYLLENYTVPSELN